MDRHLRGVLTIHGRKGCSKNIRATLRCFLKSSIGQSEWFCRHEYKIGQNSYSKGSFMTTFQGRMDRHLRGVLTIFLSKKVLQILLRKATIFLQANHWTALMFF